MNTIEKTLADIKVVLQSDDIPKEGRDCDYCPYRTAAGKALLTKFSEKKVIKKADTDKHEESKQPEQSAPTLF